MILLFHNFNLFLSHIMQPPCLSLFYIICALFRSGKMSSVTTCIKKAVTNVTALQSYKTSEPYCVTLHFPTMNKCISLLCDPKMPTVRTMAHLTRPWKSSVFPTKYEVSSCCHIFEEILSHSVPCDGFSAVP